MVGVGGPRRWRSGVVAAQLRSTTGTGIGPRPKPRPRSCPPQRMGRLRGPPQPVARPCPEIECLAGILPGNTPRQAVRQAWRVERPRRPRLDRSPPPRARSSEETSRRSLRRLRRSASGSELAGRLRITSLLRLQRFVAQHAGEEIGHRAGRALHAVRPELSSRGGPPLLAFASVASAMAGAAMIAPQTVLVALEIVLGFMFLAWTALRLFGLFGERPVHRRLNQPTTDGCRSTPSWCRSIAKRRQSAALSPHCGGSTTRSKNSTSRSSWRPTIARPAPRFRNCVLAHRSRS